MVEVSSSASPSSPHPPSVASPPSFPTPPRNSETPLAPRRNPFPSRHCVRNHAWRQRGSNETAPPRPRGTLSVYATRLVVHPSSDHPCCPPYLVNTLHSAALRRGRDIPSNHPPACECSAIP